MFVSPSSLFFIFLLFFSKEFNQLLFENLNHLRFNISNLVNAFILLNHSDRLSLFLVEPYIFNINKYFEEEKIPSINLYPESSSNSQMPTSLSCSSSIERDERTISNIDLDKQMITSNDDLDLSRLASEV